MLKGAPWAKILYQALDKPKGVHPSKPLPSIRTELINSASATDTPVITWFGHSSYLIQSKGINILVDPVFSGHAAPVSFLNHSFAGSDVYKAKDMPAIDLMILSHNHYDHLDKKTIVELKTKTKQFLVPIGAGPDLADCGINASMITELDWWEQWQPMKEIDLISVPARHFSGRNLHRNRSLWSAFVLKIHGFTILLGGDSGYEQHFAEIGKRFGPFDLAILECGQYNHYWPYIHMMPEQTYQAAKDLGARYILPVHWAKFSLAVHPWAEPVERMIAVDEPGGPVITTPMIGEQVILGKVYPKSQWWR